MMAVVADEIFGRHDDLLAGQPPEDFGHHLVNGLLVVWLQLILVLGVQQILGHVELKADLFVQLQLHHQEGVAGLTLAQWRVKTQDNECVSVVILREQEELFDGGVLDFVVVGLPAESEGRFIHVNIETTTKQQLVGDSQDGRERPTEG